MHPLLLIDGWAHTSKTLRPLTDHLAKTFAVQCVSPHTLDGSDYAHGLADLLERQSQKPVVLGWSMGGIIALQTAGMRPELFSRLILVSSTARFCSDADYPCGIESEALASMRAGMDRAPQRVLGRFYDQSCRPHPVSAQSRDVFIEEAMALGISELARGLDYLAATDLRAILKDIALPVLLLHGEEDAIIPSSASVYLAGNLPSSKVILKIAAGHNLPEQDVFSIAEAVKQFGR